MSEIRPVRLPDRFYLARTTRFGFEVRDVMPWNDAVAYVTDGARFGAQLRSGRIVWFLRPGVGALRADRYHLDLGVLPEAVRAPVDPHDLVQAIWRENRSVWDEHSADRGGNAAA